MVCEEHGRAFAKRGSGILEICSYTHSVIHACAPANYGVLGQLVGKTKPGSPVVAVNWNISSVSSVREERSPDQLFLAQPNRLQTEIQQIAISICESCISAAQINIHPAVAGEIAELDA